MKLTNSGTHFICSVNKNIRFVGLLLVAFLFILPSLASAATFYVSTTGNDTTGLGTSDKPWKTITHAAANVPAGTAGAPNVISVAAGTYDVTGNGETFPITFANDHVTLTGAGSSTTIIDPEDINTEDALHLDATGISVSGFTFQNISNKDAIVITEGGFNIHHNVFEATVKDGITFSREETDYTGNITFADMAITSNVFKTTQNGVYVYVEIDFDVAVTGLTASFGNFTISNNTFTPTSGDSIYMSPLFYPRDITSGTVTAGNFVATGNTITGGDGGIYFYNEVGNMANTGVTVGNFDVSSNTFTNQSAYSILVDDYWKMGNFSGTTNVVYGDFTVSGNTIDSVPTGIDMYFKDLHADAGAKVNIGALDIQDNTLSNISLYGVEIYYYNSNNNPATATLNIGAATVSDNTITGTTKSDSGIYLGVENLTDGITLGMPTLTGNTISGFNYGINLEYLLEASLSCNYLENNNLVGMVFYNTDGTNFKVQTNSLVNNTVGLSVDKSGTAVVNAENNWWGDEAGPAACVSCNGVDPGVGGTVDYEPWLTEQPDKARCGQSFPWLMFMPPITGMGK